MLRLSACRWKSSFYAPVDSSRCFLRALAKAPTSFMGLAVAHLLYTFETQGTCWFRPRCIPHADSFTPQLKDPAVVPSANRCTTCVLLCLHMRKSGFHDSFCKMGSYTTSWYWSDPSDSSSLEESVELLSEDSSTAGSGL